MKTAHILPEIFLSERCIYLPGWMRLLGRSTPWAPGDLNVGDQQEFVVFLCFSGSGWNIRFFVFWWESEVYMGDISRNLCRCYINFFQLKQWRWRDRDDLAMVLMELGHLGHPRMSEIPADSQTCCFLQLLKWPEVNRSVVLARIRFPWECFEKDPASEGTSNDTINWYDRLGFKEDWTAGSWNGLKDVIANCRNYTLES